MCIKLVLANVINSFFIAIIYLYPMLSINQSKLIRSLSQKKYREKHGLFVIEGSKIINDILFAEEFNNDNIYMICATNEWLQTYGDVLDKDQFLVVEASTEELNKVSGLQSPPPVLAVHRMPSYAFEKNILREDILPVFESVRDPGNLGTIIRTADWFGYKNIICSKDSVDLYNNKVIQSSMGAILRVHTHYMELAEMADLAERMKVPLYGTTMEGEDFFESSIKNPGIIVFGNESTGISQEIKRRLRSEIRIPDYPSGKSGTESLNLAASVSIVCSELRRRSR